MNSSSMSIRNSVGLDWKPFLRSKNLPFKPIFLDASFSRKNINPNCFPGYVRLGGFGNNSSNNYKNKRSFVAYSNGGNDSDSWKGYVLSIAISVILSYFTQKSGPSDTWKKKFDEGLQNIEDTVEAFKQIAQVVAKEAAKPLGRLHDGWVKHSLTLIEHGAEIAEKFFAIIDYLIDTIQGEEPGDEKSKDSEENDKK